MYVCAYTVVCVHVCVYRCVIVCVCISACACTYVCVFVCTSVCMYVGVLCYAIFSLNISWLYCPRNIADGKYCAI